MRVAEASSQDRILKKSLDLFSRKGYDATSVREICEAAAITKPTLYHFYGSKEGVYRALVEGSLDDFQKRLADLTAVPGTTRERLRRVARGYFHLAQENRQLVRLLFSLAHNPPSSAPLTDFPRHYDGIVARVAQVVEQGVAAGELEPGPTDVRMLVLMGALGESLVGYLLTGKPTLSDELAHTLVDSVLDGWARKTAP